MNKTKFSETQKRYFAYAGMLFIVTMWAIEFIIARVALSVISVGELAFFRFFISAIAMFVIMKVTRASFRIEKTDVPILLAIALVGCIYFTSEYTALSYMSASLVSIILALLPIIALIIEIILTRTWTGWRKLICVILSLVGVIVIIASENTLSGGSLMGFFFAFLCVLFWAISNHLLVKLLKKYSPITITFYRNFTNTFFLMPLFILAKPIAANYTIKVILAILFLGIVSSALLNIGYSSVIRVIGPLPAAVCSNFLPVVTVLMSYLILGEGLNIIQAFGCGLILLSIFLIIDYGPRELEPEEEPQIKSDQ